MKQTYQITRKNLLTNVEKTLPYEMTPDQYQRLQARRENMQQIFPEYTPAQREFLISGMTQEDWSAAFGKI